MAADLKADPPMNAAAAPATAAAAAGAGAGAKGQSAAKEKGAAAGDAKADKPSAATATVEDADPLRAMKLQIREVVGTGFVVGGSTSTDAGGDADVGRTSARAPCKLPGLGLPELPPSAMRGLAREQEKLQRAVTRAELVAANATADVNELKEALKGADDKPVAALKLTDSMLTFTPTSPDTLSNLPADAHALLKEAAAAVALSTAATNDACKAGATGAPVELAKAVQTARQANAALRQLRSRLADVQQAVDAVKFVHKMAVQECIDADSMEWNAAPHRHDLKLSEVMSKGVNFEAAVPTPWATLSFFRKHTSSNDTASSFTMVTLLRGRIRRAVNFLSVADMLKLPHVKDVAQQIIEAAKRANGAVPAAQGKGDANDVKAQQPQQHLKQLHDANFMVQQQLQRPLKVPIRAVDIHLTTAQGRARAFVEFYGTHVATGAFAGGIATLRDNSQTLTSSTGGGVELKVPADFGGSLKFSHDHSSTRSASVLERFGGDADGKPDDPSAWAATVKNRPHAFPMKLTRTCDLFLPTETQEEAEFVAAVKALIIERENEFNAQKMARAALQTEFQKWMASADARKHSHHIKTVADYVSLQKRVLYRVIATDKSDKPAGFIRNRHPHVDVVEATFHVGANGALLRPTSQHYTKTWDEFEVLRVTEKWLPVQPPVETVGCDEPALFV